MDTNLQNIACRGKILSICNKQHLSNIDAQFITKLKKYVAYKKSMYYQQKSNAKF